MNHWRNGRTKKLQALFKLAPLDLALFFTSPNGWRETVCGYFCVWVFSVAEEETQPVAERCRTKNALERERGNHGLIRLPQATTLSFLCAHTCGSTRAPYSGQLSKLYLSFFLSNKAAQHIVWPLRFFFYTTKTLNVLSSLKETVDSVGRSSFPIHSVCNLIIIRFFFSIRVNLETLER